MICSVKYSEMRTGLTFAEVSDMLWTEVEAEYASSGRYKGKPSRAMILGKWRAIKLSMWSRIPPEEREDEF